MRHLQAGGFPERNWPQVCTAIQARKFLSANGLEIESVDGPPKKQSPTVVVRYHVASQVAKPATGTIGREAEAANLSEETPSARASRLTGKLRGLLKDELAEYGGGEAFLRWIRSEEEKAA
jgi:hypothetical protein